MIEKLLDLPPHVRERLASALESGLIACAPTTAALRSLLGRSARLERVAKALAEFDRIGVPSAAAAQWIRSLTAAETRTPRIDLVWSGPEVLGFHARDTRRVYEELLACAERSLCVSSYVFFDGPRAFATLAQRMEVVPDLRVMLLLNIQRKRGDTTAAEELVRRFAERFWRTEWPGTSRPMVFYDPRALDPDLPTGVLHAKAVVADGEMVFVTSANLTEAALDRNIELGLLTRDRSLAASIVMHFQTLIDHCLLIPIPSD